jgi:7-carboxy-7-deazaguanine synthase
MAMQSDPLPVNELFETVQGEGFHTGTPAVFIRLQGCPVGCPWCDTKYTWADPEIAREISAGDVVTKNLGEESFGWMSVSSMVELVSQYRSKHVVITGGEPCLYDLLPLTTELIAAGKRVQIETSGTFAVQCDPGTWVTVSPKIGMPGGLELRDAALARADELKMPVGKPDDVVMLFELLDRCGKLLTVRGGMERVYLQPLSLSRKATDLCVQSAIANGFKLSLQTHAMTGIR